MRPSGLTTVTTQYRRRPMNTARFVSRLSAGGPDAAVACLAQSHELTTSTDADLVVLETNFADPAADVGIIRGAAGAAVLVLSPSTRREHVELTRDVGAHAYLIEPFTDDDFTTAVRTAEVRAGKGSA